MLTNFKQLADSVNEAVIALARQAENKLGINLQILLVIDPEAALKAFKRHIFSADVFKHLRRKALKRYRCARPVNALAVKAANDFTHSLKIALGIIDSDPFGITVFFFCRNNCIGYN